MIADPVGGLDAQFEPSNIRASSSQASQIDTFYRWLLTQKAQTHFAVCSVQSIHLSSGDILNTTN